MSEQEQRYLKPYGENKKDKKLIIVNPQNKNSYLERQEADISEIDLLKEELAQVIVRYEKRLVKLENKDYDKKLSTYERRLATAESKIKELEKQIERLQDVHGKEETTVNHMKLEKIIQERASRASAEKRNFVVPLGGFSYDGWVYYPNQEMGNFLYRVSSDGRYREQLTDYSVVEGLWSVREGKLFFRDANRREHSIKI